MVTLDVATQNPVRSVKILFVILNFIDAVVICYVGRGLGVHGQPCHISIDFFPLHLAVITLLGGRSVRLLPLSHFKLRCLSALVQHMVLFWRPAFVRNSTFAVFSVRHFRSAVFSVRSRSDFSGRMTLRMQRIPYPRTFLAV